MSSVDLKFEVGDLVIPNSCLFKDDECRIVTVYLTSAFVETLNPDKFGRGHKGGTIISVENGWNYNLTDLVHSFRYGFKIGDRVKTPNGVGIIKCFNKEFGSIGVAHDEVNYFGHTIDGYCEEGYGRFYFKDELSHFTEEPMTPVTPEKRFSVGQKVTYKPESSLPKGYIYGGINQGGFVGEIKDYVEFVSDHNCYKITVTTKEESSYSMLESEFEDYLDPAFTAKKASKPTQRFKVGDKVTYKSIKSLPDSRYNYGGCDQGLFVGTIKYYGSYYPEYGCYSIYVSTKTEGDYNMLESEFFEYDSISTGYTTIGSDSVPYYGITGVVVGTGSTKEVTGALLSADTWAGIMEEEFKKRDEDKKQDLSDYIQAPSVPKKKSTKRKLVIVDRF
jgi:hypothetical protein